MQDPILFESHKVNFNGFFSFYQKHHVKSASLKENSSWQDVPCAMLQASTVIVNKSSLSAGCRLWRCSYALLWISVATFGESNASDFGVQKDSFSMMTVVCVISRNPLCGFAIHETTVSPDPFSKSRVGAQRHWPQNWWLKYYPPWN